MKKGSEILLNLVAGAVGGVLVMMLIQNSPKVARFFQESEALIPEAPLISSESGVGEEIKTSDYESLIVSTVERVNPAVVSIVITKDVPIIERYYEEEPNTPFNPFGDFFGGDQLFSPFNMRVPQYRQKGTEKREVGGGSGFIVSADGLVVTNRHVVDQDGVDYTVFMNDGTKFDAEVLARDSVNDLAVIKIEGKDLPFLEFDTTSELKVGQTVIAIGNALAEFRNTVSVGVISGLSRSITAGDGRGQSEQIDEVIQTDAAINPGNSGGPLLSASGQVIGVNVAVALGSENIGFALPGNAASDIVNSVRETGRIVRPYIGVRYTMITPVLVKMNNLPVDYGALIARGEPAEELAVMPGSPADKAGLAEGDIILEVDGVKLENKVTLSSVIRKHKVEDKLSLKALSKGDEKIVSITLKEIPQ